MTGCGATATAARWRATPPARASPSCATCCCATWPTPRPPRRRRRRRRRAACWPGWRGFPGVSLRAVVVEGRVRKADDLLALLADAGRNGVLGPETILVVPHLEPSWAVLFPRVGGVVAGIGGELSHASILLREAGKPALVNCTGIFRQVQNGDRLRLDGKRGLAILLVK